MDLARLRGRLPLIVFVLLAVVCLALIGFACACFTDHATQAVDRATSLGSALSPLVEIWGVFAALAVPSLLVARGIRPFGRASPQLMQRFLF